MMRSRLLARLEGEALGARLARGAAGALTVNVVGAGLAFASQLILARVLGAEDYGVYAYVFAWISVLTLVSTLGFRTSLLRFVATYRTHEQWGLLRGVVRYAESRVALTGSMVAFIGAAFTWLIAARLQPPLAHTFLLGFAVIPVYALLYVRSSTVRGLGRVVPALAPDKVVREAILVLLIGGIGFGASTMLTAPSAMAVLLAATLASLILVSLAQRHARPRKWASIPPSAEHAADWRRSSLLLLVFSGTLLALSHIDIFIVGALLDTTAAGTYFLAARITDLVAFPLITINAFFAPIIASYHSSHDHASLQRAVTLTVRASLISALPIAAGILLLSTDILRLLGSEFVQANSTIGILLVGQLINACTGPAGLLLTMTGEERAASALAVMLLPLAGLALWILVPLLGIDGAAIVRTFVIIALNIAYVTIALRRIGIAAAPFPLPLLPRPFRIT